MKKKLLLIVSSIVVAVVITAMVMFALSGHDDASAEPLNMEGIWKVAVSVSTGSMSIVDNEYMIFNGNTASDYRDGEVFVKSSFSLDSSLQMNLPDIGRKYSVTRYTDNYIRLYESQDTYMDLIRYGNPDMGPIDFDTASFDGTWDIAFRMTDRVYAGDYMVFENGTASQYSGGAPEPTTTTSYSWQDGNHLLVDAWSKEMVAYPLSDSVVMLVELATDTGCIWELQRVG